MKSFTSLLFFAASVAAHGWVNSITIGGKAYPGHSPFSNGGASVIRQVTTNEPVLDPQGKDITCGPGAYKPASLVANAKAGDKILVDWAATSGNWFHDVGPMMTYLASCGSTTCDKFDASKAKWFKIQEQGQDAQGKWAQEKIMDGSPASVTLPSTLAPGNYLLRSEIVALQNGMFPGKSEFYPSCAQLKVSGSGSGAPAASELVSLPGAYKPTDAGIKVDVYNMKSAYRFPGPAVAAFVSGKSAPNAPSEPEAPAKPATTKKADAPAATKPVGNVGSNPAPSTTTAKAAPTTCKTHKERRRSRIAQVHRAAQENVRRSF
ncbi:glycoside hydrolase family 61 protein [Mycena rebaudengoi]|nr:glycoside hydrolase family 61 protein [Mycena rebaudengoi]